MVNRRPELTFQYNVGRGRHGWLRLTPAYSVKVVEEILNDYHPSYVLDPFSGTGTTGVVCGERSISCDLLEINPFLVWLARVKTSNYSNQQLHETLLGAERIVSKVVQTRTDDNLWVPPIKNIERWWEADKLKSLAKFHRAINECFPVDSSVKDLLLVAFCRLLIEWSNAAFNHQSMSFRNENIAQPRLFEMNGFEGIRAYFLKLIQAIVASVQNDLKGQVQVIHQDSRNIPPVADRRYDCVITSPPYPNRISYVRELRPYMYWLGYLKHAAEAGDLDWQAIGGTWGSATSRLERWQPERLLDNCSGLDTIIQRISRVSPILAKYVHKYFLDMATHLENLYQVLAPEAKVFYIVGNSRFYDTLVPVEGIYVDLLQNSGFVNTYVEVLRKRNSKKELFEYVVSAQKPGKPEHMAQRLGTHLRGETRRPERAIPTPFHPCADVGDA